MNIMEVKFENGSVLYMKNLGAALEYAHKNNTKILRILS